MVRRLRGGEPRCWPQGDRVKAPALCRVSRRVHARLQLKLRRGLLEVQQRRCGVAAAAWRCTATAEALWAGARRRDLQSRDASVGALLGTRWREGGVMSARRRVSMWMGAG